MNSVANLCDFSLPLEAALGADLWRKPAGDSVLVPRCKRGGLFLLTLGAVLRPQRGWVWHDP